MAHLFARPERLGDTFLDTGALTMLRNRENWLSLLEAALDGDGMAPSLVLTDADWRSLRMPVTFVWGDKDVFDTVAHGQAVTAAVPDGRFVLMEDAGHLPWVDQPDAVAAEIVQAVGAGDRVDHTGVVGLADATG
jgi:pimeloyl-ACP methyl ester carboxylesterase